MTLTGRLSSALALNQVGRRGQTVGRAPQAEARAGRGRQPRLNLVTEPLFRDALVRESRRVTRAGTDFAVLLVEVAERVGAGSLPVWSAVVHGMSAARRRSDLLGWFETGTVLGLILNDITADGAQVAAQVEGRIRRHLARSLDPQVLGRISVRRYAVRSGASADNTGVSSVNDLLQAMMHTPRTRLRRGLKRALDIVGSLTALVLLAPLFAVVAVLVKLGSPGPVFFRQSRVGEGGRLFEMLKFRTMYVGSDPRLHQEYVSWFIKASDRERHAASNGIFKLQDDPRVTPIGRILRRTSLDELPQFWNVLKGDMSLVGPRPPLPFEVEQYQPWHRRRVLDARPGITGLWQVTGRSRTTFDEMVRLDLRYAKTWSVWTDIKILLATPRAVISGKGAC